jgi:pyridoxal biosynthesis lyase PdxS
LSLTVDSIHLSPYNPTHQRGEAGTGNVVEAVRHARAVQREIRKVTAMDEDELYVFAKEIRVRDS